MMSVSNSHSQRRLNDLILFIFKMSGFESLPGEVCVPTHISCNFIPVRPQEHLHIPSYMRGTNWCCWLSHCAKSRKVAVSISDGVIGIFHWHTPSGCTMALGLTQPLTEMNTRNISWGVGLTTLPTSCADCLEIWEPQPPGTLTACSGM